MIKAFCIAGQPEEIVEQLHELERQGLKAINFSIPVEKQYRVTEDFARRVMARM
jgi:alkanesulfonate monooxygenase SsuD/methylene tetrahydromethanopterin reductase-like flavin-dependent oxidoreductase (luciferase family)